jgi:hypothetical protein
MYEASIGVFVPFLGNLSELLDRGAAHAEACKIDPSVLPNMRLYPNMYSLRQQVGEANRHAILAGALLARRDPLTLADGETDIAGLKSRIKMVIDLRACHVPKSTAPRIGRSSLPSRTATSGNSQVVRCCSRSACRSSFFT